MKKLLLLTFLLLTSLAYSQISHKTVSTLQLDVANPVTHADSILVYKPNKLVDFISYNDFVAQLEATGISGGGGAGDPTNLSVVHSATTAQIVSSTGTNGLMQLATNTLSGLLSPTDKAKLDGLVDFDPTNYARKDISETFAQSVTIVSGLRIGNQTNYGAMSFYGGSGGAERVTVLFDEATKNLKFTNYEASGQYIFDKPVTVGTPVSSLDATNIAYFATNLSGTSNTIAFTPISDYHPATKKYVDDAITAGGGYTDEAAQDAIGSILVDGSNINFTYNDGVPSITGEVIEANLSITESQITDFGSYISLADNNIFTGSNTFNELIVNDVTNAEITAGANNVLITKDWYNNNLYHTASNITFTPTGNTTSATVQDAVVEIQSEIDGFTFEAFNTHFPIASNYTTLFTNNNQKGIITSGGITLNDADAGIAAEYQVQFLNSSGSDVTITLGPGQSTKQYGIGVIPNLSNNQYAYLELISDNIWSIIVGRDIADIGDGVTDHTQLTSVGTNTHVAIDNHIADATTHFTAGSIVHTVDTDTQLNQAEVGTFATNEGFIKTFNEADPYWNAVEADVPRLSTENIFALRQTYTNGITTGGILLSDIGGTINHLTDGIMLKAFNTQTLALENTYVRLYKNLIFNGAIDIGTSLDGANRIYVDVDPDANTGVGNRLYNDNRYYQQLSPPPVDGYVFTSTAAGVTSWAPPASGGGGGDVSQFGTVANNQIAIWTGVGSIEGDSDLTFDGTNLSVTGTVSGSNITTMSNDINSLESEQTTQNNAIALNTSKVTNANHSGDVSGSTTLTINSNAVEESMLNSVNGPTDEQFLTWEASSGQFQWQAGLAGVTSVTAGTGMTQTGTATINPTLNVIGGNGIISNADNIALTTLTTDWNAGTQDITAGGFYESSLRIFKTNILPFTKSALELINSLEIVTFDRIDGAEDKIGVIIDDTDKDFANDSEDAVDLYNTIFIQAKAIQELSAKLDTLEQRVKELEDEK